MFERTNYEAVLTPSNNLVLGAYEGTIDVTSPTGNVAVLGEGADFALPVSILQAAWSTCSSRRRVGRLRWSADDQGGAEEGEEESRGI